MAYGPLINLVVSALAAGILAGGTAYETSGSLKVALSTGFAAALAAFINHLRPNPFSDTSGGPSPNVPS